MKIPQRIFLDTNVVNFILDHEGEVFEGASPDWKLSASELDDVEALYLIFTIGRRAGWELAVSELTRAEILRTPCPRRRERLERWFAEIWQHSRRCLASHRRVKVGDASAVEKRLANSSLLRAFEDSADRALLCHAIAYECDAFCTRDRKTILKRTRYAATLPFSVVSPAEWGKLVRPYANLFC